MAQPVFEPLDPLGPLYPEERPRALIRLGIAPVPGAADILVRQAISDYDGVDGKTVVLDCFGHRWTFEGFADRLTRRLFQQGAVEILLVGTSEELFDAVQRAARRVGAEDKVRREAVHVLHGLR